MRYFQLGLAMADHNSRESVAQYLMRPFLVEVMGIFPENSCQLPAIKDECMVQAFSTIRSERLRVRSERTPEIKDRVAGLVHCLMRFSSLKRKGFQMNKLLIMLFPVFYMMSVKQHDNLLRLYF